jgi:hypothetical protein
METKICTKCGIEYPATLDYFFKQGYYLKCHCKSCCKLDIKKYRETNKEQIKAHEQAYREFHKEQLKIKRKIYTESHKEQIKAYQQTYRDSNKEYIKKIQKEYFANNKEKILAYNKEYNKTHKVDPIKIRERQLRYFNNHKNDMLLKEKRSESVNKYQKSKKGILNLKKYRSSEKYKKIKRDQQKKYTDSITDAYISALLKIPFNEVKKYPELIEAKRLQIQIHRLTKKENHE